MIAATDQSVEVWPENWPAFSLFAQLGTQWAAGMGGPTGLRYEALYPLLDRRCPTDDEWQQTFADVRAMETAALTAMRSKD